MSLSGHDEYPITFQHIAQIYLKHSSLYSSGIASFVTGLAIIHLRIALTCGGSSFRSDEKVFGVTGSLTIIQAAANILDAAVVDAANAARKS